MPVSLSAWILITDKEGYVNLRSRVCFPRRICIAVDKPSSPIAEHQLRIASCAVDIAGQLYVLTAGAKYPEETCGSPQPRPSESRVNVKECVRLGRVVNHSRTIQFTLIEVADTFQTCRDQGCSACLTPINNCWATTRIGPHGLESVQLTTLKKGNTTTGVQDAVLTHVINLEYPAKNKDHETFADCSRYLGWIAEPGLPERLSITDSGSLVSSGGQDIGISTRIMPGSGVASVLLFADKLWDYVANLSQVCERMGETQSGTKVSNAWKHLEDRGQH
ncbi:hypothetical protein F5B21DRAFT_387307 [Xylaria acuta]|nr:hypothetical protein F5B21DRAFT_387307 [Xylaria acuta]